MNLFNSQAISRVAPFAVFMAFIGLEQGLRALLELQVLNFEAVALNWLYLPKAVLVGLLLWLLRKRYVEINTRELRDYRQTALSIFSGLLVFVLWINMDWTLGSQGDPAEFDPEVFSTETSKWLMILVRISGAVIIVPIMEELFWRSFLLRYLIDANFTAVTIGRFSLFSFLAVSILFGLEHHYVFAGIMAGVIFNGIYYYTRSIAQCILSHAVANLSLAVYVFLTQEWRFW
ncbi:MAG: CAAX prenyl protease-related protein [Desulfuromonadales bacterium]